MILDIKSDGKKSYLQDNNGNILLNNLKYASFINDIFITILNEDGTNIFDIRTKKLYFDVSYKAIIFDQNGFFILKDDVGYKIFDIESKNIIQRNFNQKPEIYKENGLFLIKEKIDYNEYNYYVITNIGEKTVIIPECLYNIKEKFGIVYIGNEYLFYYKDINLYFRNSFLYGKYIFLEKGSTNLILDSEKLEYIFPDFLEITHIFENCIFIKENSKINVFSLGEKTYLYKGFDEVKFLNDTESVFLIGNENSVLFSLKEGFLEKVNSFLSFTEFTSNLLIVNIDSKYKNIFDIEKGKIIFEENFLEIQNIQNLNFIALYYENTINLHYKDNLKLFQKFKTKEELNIFLEKINDVTNLIEDFKNNQKDIVKSVKKYGINHIKIKSGILIFNKEQNIFVDENNNVIEKWYLDKNIVINLSKKEEISYIIEDTITANLKDDDSYEYIYKLSLMLVNMMISNNLNGVDDFQGPYCYENFYMFTSFGKKASISEIKTIIELFKENIDISIGNFPIEDLFLGIIENEEFFMYKTYLKENINHFIEYNSMDDVIFGLCEKQYFEKDYLENIVNKYFSEDEEKQKAKAFLK